MPKINLTSILWPFAILIIALSAFYLKPWQTKPAETISVSAEGKSQVTPNIAKITATIESKNINLDEARRQNEIKVSTIINKLKELGIEKKDIKTQNISAGPGGEIQIYPPRRPDTNAFSTSLEVTLRNFEIADETLATLTQNGATNLYGPNLTLDEKAQEDAKAKARENAVEAARKKAQQLAKLSERRLGKAVKIQEQQDIIFPQPLIATGEFDLKRKASQIQPGQNEVTINLLVDFSLK